MFFYPKRSIFTMTVCALKHNWAHGAALGSTRSFLSSTIRSSHGAGSSYGLLAAACSGVLLSSTCLQAHAEAADRKADGEDPYAKNGLYPLMNAPVESGTLPVDSRHTIAYTVWGNRKGKPVLFVHGGPGGGTNPDQARFFDPEKYCIVLVDQRGCGKSTPFADLVDNTTWDSVRDFEKLRKKLGIDKWQVFGGSWGSTLALCYAIKHPERVSELVLRGIFLLRKKEIDWFYRSPGGVGAGSIFPAEWAVYESAIPPEERGDYVAAYGRRLRGELGDEEMRKAARAWSIWEGRTSNLVQAPADDVDSKFGSDAFSLAFARIENHYFTNYGFFEEGFLLQKKNLDKIRHIPTFIVQGRYDVVCPAMSAWELNQALPHSELHLTLTGHSQFEPEISKKLVEATDRFSNR